MKILHVYRDYSLPGGVPEQTRSLATAEADLDHHVAAACVRGSDMVESRGVRVHCFGNRLQSIIQMFLLQAFKKFDVILVSSMLIPIQAVWTSTLLVLGGKIVLSPQGQLSPIGMRVRFGGKKPSRARIIGKNLFFALVDRRLLRLVTAVQAQSQYEAELAMKLWSEDSFCPPRRHRCFMVSRTSQV